MAKAQKKQSKSTKTAQKKGGAAAQAVGRKVLYPPLKPNPTTVARAKELLGWEEETEENKFGATYVRELKGLYPTKVRCNNNVTNRPIYRNILLTLRQEILRGKWHFNGEPIIIGKTGLILNGQHTLLALILAGQEVVEHPEKWSKYWKSSPTIEKMVVFGVDETDNVVNTMDTCKPRSLADVIYRSSYFSGVAPNDRRIAARMTGFAVKLLWERTGAKLNAYAPMRTHSEALDFIERHPKLIQCVEHIFEEDGNGQLTQYVPSGTTSGLLYLMASGKTDPSKYRCAENPGESLLDFGLWSKACDFFVLLAGNAPEILEVNKARKRMLNRDSNPSHTESCALVVKAWLQYLKGKSIKAEHLKLKYAKDEDGYDQLTEHPIAGGIDYGKSPTAEEAGIVDEGKNEPTAKEVEEIKARTKKVKAQKVKAQRESDPRPKTKAAKPKAKTAKKKSSGKGVKLIGKMAWVEEEDGSHWRGKVVEALGKNARLKVAQGHEGAGNIRTALVASLKPKQPAGAA